MPAVESFVMERGCNLELRLSPSPSSSDSGDHHHRPRFHQFMTEEPSKNPQPLTIFYNGRVCAGEFTEQQARAIIMLATRQMEERPTSRVNSEPSSSSDQSNSTAGSGLSMKRSLQRFLQKRKHRIQAASPYHH